MSKPKAGPKELRTFGFTMFCALCVLGGILLWQGRATGFVLWATGLALVLIASTRPGILAPLYVYWMKLALLMGLVMSHVILAVLYYLVVTPIGLAMRACGKNPLTLRSDENSKSYWIPRRGRQAKERYEKMF